MSSKASRSGWARGWGKLAQHLAELIDARLGLGAQVLRECVPVLPGRRLPRRQRGQYLAYFGQGEADSLARLDHRETAHHIAVVAALVSGRAVAADEALRLVEPNRRRRDSATLRHLTDGQAGLVPVEGRVVVHARVCPAEVDLNKC